MESDARAASAKKKGLTFERLKHGICCLDEVKEIKKRKKKAKQCLTTFLLPFSNYILRTYLNFTCLRSPSSHV